MRHRKRAGGTARPVEAKSAAAPPADPEAFRRGLTAIVRESGAAATGHIQFLGLDAVRERLGDRWERLANRIHATTRQCIKAHISASDLFVQYDDMTYLLAFSGSDESDAALKCAVIAKAIDEALFGEDGIDSIQIQSIVSVVDDELVLETVSLQDCLDMVAENASKTGTPVASPSAQANAGAPVKRAPAATAPDTASAPEANPGNGRTARATPAGQGQLELATVDPPAQPAPPTAPAAHRAPAQSAMQLPVVPAAPLTSSRPEANVGDLRFVYVPIWNARKEAITAYHCVPTKITAEGAQFGYTAIYGNHSRVQPVEVDILALRHSIERFAELIANSFEYIAVHSVHFNTITIPMQRRAFLASCHCIPADMAPYQTLEIFGAPATVPTSRYTDMISMLKPFFRTVYLRMSVRGEHLATAGAAGFDGFSMPIADSPETADEKLAQLAETGEKLLKLGVFSYAFDLRSTESILFAADAGFEWVGGHMVLKPVDIPSHVVRYPRSNFEAA